MRSFRFAAGLGALALFATTISASLAGCGEDDGSLFRDGAGDAGETSSSSSGGFTPTPETDAEVSACGPTGKSCGDGGVCAGETCCAASRACGDVCCPSGDVCSFQKCVVPGVECRDSTECGANEYCDYGLGTSTTGGGGGGGDASCVGGSDRTGKCLPRPPECAPGAGPAPGGPIACLEKCEFRPATPTFAPELKLAWGGVTTSPFDTDVMMAQIVIQLDDDDCDGKVTERDIPEIVFSTFQKGEYKKNGKLRAISAIGGAFVEKWTVPNDKTSVIINPTKQIAAANFDGKPGNEIVACGVDGKVHAFNGVDGSLLWSTASSMDCFMPSIADLDGDGAVEVIVEGGILDGADGTLEHGFVPALDGPFVVSDLDADGKLDIVTASRGYKADGTVFVDTGVVMVANFPNESDWKGPWAAIADFDLDGKPEVVVVDNNEHKVHLWRYDATKPSKFAIVRAPVDMNANFTAECPVGRWGATHGGGPPTIADFDRDGVPDVGLAGGVGYVVFDGKKLINPDVSGEQAILWGKVTTDCSSASTGSTVFDFDGDGKAEVVYSDEVRLRIYEGATGKELASVCNTTATLVEFPVVADVDNDGQADIVVVSNAYSQTCDEPGADGGAPTSTRQAGVRVFGPASGSWVRTRRVWNQHAYHVTNVAEDGTIPKNEPANWTQKGLNNFRQNKQPGSEFAAPNLVVTLASACASSTPSNGVFVNVRNIGEAVAPAGVVVGVYAGALGSGTKLGAVTTTRPLYPAEAEPLVFTFASSSPPSSVYAVVDDGSPPHPSWTECRTDDNTSGAISPACASPK